VAVQASTYIAGFAAVAQLDRVLGCAPSECIQHAWARALASGGVRTLKPALIDPAN